ncbi:MAG: sugar kinase [Candidatus Dadabacteria bacterium]|nr:sugar kinase [Candidatus Dadabacteria bacterium]MYA47742.1 sugar kinase [Candidatus Dadabacteria bacterium]MYF47384.1 sugar kinase [Candidatus Dadabacteria bacterium]MYG83221.1 sugar kinase [Candidatus Dadabacteria bacterium]MYK50090.1 sugar kinase [Candidatus Dadabacteria bacterium]
MSIVVVGSVGIDTIETPFGREEDVLGGSACYFSLAARNFTDVHMVSSVGEDFPPAYSELLRSRGIDTEGIAISAGETFRWEGRYDYDMKDPETVSVILGVLGSFDPVVPQKSRDADYLFLANTDPEIQMKVLEQVSSPRVVACDTMNFWIDNKLEELKTLLGRVNILIINDSEARQLSEEPLMARAARKIMDMGPEFLIVKRGEYGALLFSREDLFFAPSYMLEQVLDPTGAGDTFAGGFMGYVASRDGDLDFAGFKKAVAYGSVLASFTVEDFSVRRLGSLEKEEIEQRYVEFLRLSTM